MINDYIPSKLGVARNEDKIQKLFKMVQAGPTAATKCSAKEWFISK